jgi:serralysin
VCVFCQNLGLAAHQAKSAAALASAGYESAETSSEVSGVSSVSRTFDQNIDGLLIGQRWTSGSLTFSFPQSASEYGADYPDTAITNNFEVLNQGQQSAVRSILQNYAAVANLTFTEMDETATSHAVLRFGVSDKPGTAYAYYPNTSATAGDSFYNNTTGWYDNPVPGNYAWFTFIHEIGHNLGLKHGHDTSVYGAMSADRDSMEYSVMTYRSYVGGPLTGYSNETWGFAQTLMMYDIAALQRLYGANYGTNGGDTVYSWSATTGEMFVNGTGQGAPGANRLFLTVWDGGGEDTYNFASYTANLVVDLRPGAWSTAWSAQVANLGDGRFAAGNVANALLFEGNPASLIENAVAGAGHDTLAGNEAGNLLAGNEGNDSISGGAGNDQIWGGAGSDVIYGNQDRDLIYSNQGTDTIYGGQDPDTLFGGQGADVLYGNQGDDFVFGNLENDTLFGGQGADTMYGGQGDDVLIGGAGDDVLIGNLGADRFVAGAGSGADTIMDFSFSEGDRLDIQGQSYTVRDLPEGLALDLSGGGVIVVLALDPVDLSTAYFV